MAERANLVDVDPIGEMDADDLAGTERMLAKWAQMGRDAQACFQQRFLIDRSAESFISAMEIHGLRRHVPNLPGRQQQAAGTP